MGTLNKIVIDRRRFRDSMVRAVYAGGYLAAGEWRRD